MSKFKRYQYITLVVPGGDTGTRFNFADQPNLRNDSTQDIIITGIEAYSNLNFPTTVFGGGALPTMAQLQNAFLVLYIKGEESIQWVPMTRLLGQFATLATSASQAWYEPFDLENLSVEWEKCYIVAATPFNSDDPITFAFGIKYKKLAPGTWEKLTANQIPGL
jgi:hypothetical protein